MDEETPQENEMPGEDTEEVPVCIRCFRPVDPVAHYCPHCGAATGTFTHYLPCVNIPWQASVWGQTWRQMRSPDISWAGRLFRLFMIVWNVPVMLIGVLFRSERQTELCPSLDDERTDLGPDSDGQPIETNHPTQP